MSYIFGYITAFALLSLLVYKSNDNKITQDDFQLIAFVSMMSWMIFAVVIGLIIYALFFYSLKKFYDKHFEKICDYILKIKNKVVNLHTI